MLLCLFGGNDDALCDDDEDDEVLVFVSFSNWGNNDDGNITNWWGLIWPPRLRGNCFLFAVFAVGGRLSGGWGRMCSFSYFWINWPCFNSYL